MAVTPIRTPCTTRHGGSTGERQQIPAMVATRVLLEVDSRCAQGAPRKARTRMETEKTAPTPTPRVPARKITPPKRTKKVTAAKPAPSTKKRRGSNKPAHAAGTQVPDGKEARAEQHAKAVSTQETTESETKRTLSATHLASLAEGREQGRDVKRYLDAIEARKPRRGRRRTVVSIVRRLEKIDTELTGANALQRLHLLQERTELQTELEATRNSELETLAELEAAFIRSVKPYSIRKGITVQTWRKMNVPAAVLRRGGM